MPSLEAAVVALLTSGSPNPVAAIVGSRVHGDALPLGITYPAIRYQRISTSRAPYRKLATGRSNYARPRFQIDCYAVTKNGALQLADAVRFVLSGYAGVSSGIVIGSSGLEDEASDREEGIGPGGVGIYHQRLDFLIGHAE